MIEPNWTEQPRTLGVDVDDATLMHEAARRVGVEFHAAVAEARAWAEGPARAARSPLPRLDAVADLFGLVGATPSSVRLRTGVSATVAALARCSCLSPTPAITVDASEAPIDGRVARAVHLVVIALLAGRTSGGAIDGGGDVEVEARLTHMGVDVIVRDFADDPPDRVALGGELLLRSVGAVGGAIAQTFGPGIATTIVRLHQSGALAYAVVGNA